MNEGFVQILRGPPYIAGVNRLQAKAGVDSCVWRCMEG